MLCSLRKLQRNSIWKPFLVCGARNDIFEFVPKSNPTLNLNCFQHSQENGDQREETFRKHFKWKYIFLAASGFAGAAFAATSLIKYNSLLAEKNNLQQAETERSSLEVSGLPVFSSHQIAEHDSPEKGVWVSFQSGVYDITKFIDEHPGGDKIKMAAGGALEPFWELYGVHKSKQVYDILEKYRIGNLNVSDQGQALKNMEDPYSNDPQRHPILKASSKKPFNAEPPLEILVDNFITPNAIFFVRNHLPVPEVNPDEYVLEIESEKMEKIVSLTLEDLKTKFPKYSVVTTIQCAGNRRSEINKVKEVKGLDWGAAAISTAEWSGARLLDVLKYCAFDVEDPFYQHVQFEGLDTDPANMPYGSSIPSYKAFDRNGDVLLAYEMNKVEIPKDHGYPIRVIAPGIVGARNVKWLAKIILSHEESNSHWQKNDYKGFSPMVDWKDVDFESSPAIQELPVNSVICQPNPGSQLTLKEGKFECRGYAWSGGGRKIIRVDVSADDGQTWTTAQLEQEPTHLNRTWAWTIWKADIIATPEIKSLDNLKLICKAVDSSYNVQPETFAPIWNLRGVLGNAWHRVEAHLRKES